MIIWNHDKQVKQHEITGYDTTRNMYELNSRPVESLKTHANVRNIVGQEHATQLGSACCARLHGTTTILVNVAYSLKPVKLLGPHKRTQNC